MVYCDGEDVEELLAGAAEADVEAEAEPEAETVLLLE